MEIGFSAHSKNYTGNKAFLFFLMVKKEFCHRFFFVFFVCFFIKTLLYFFFVLNKNSYLVTAEILPYIHRQSRGKSSGTRLEEAKAAAKSDVVVSLEGSDISISGTSYFPCCCTLVP